MTNADRMRQIVDTVSAAFNVTAADIYSPRRMRPVAQARHVAMWLCRHCTPFTIPMIGRHFNRDHTSVLHAVRQTDWRSAEDRAFAARVNELRARHQSVGNGSFTIACPIP